MPNQHVDGAAPTNPHLALIEKLKKIGIKIPAAMFTAAQYAGLPLALAASTLMQESGGGTNEWGHDPTLFIGGFDKKHNHAFGEIVTEPAYKEYLLQRGTRGQGGMQGVGPCQLTYFSFQDEADRLGGCWKPLANMKVGFSDMAHLIRKDGLHAGVMGYNGSGPAAERYADTVLARAQEFAGKLGLPWPPH